MRELQCSATLYKSYRNRFTVLLWTEDSQLFRAELPGIDLLPEIEDEVLNNAVGERIPNDHLFPPWSDTITEVKQPLSPNVLVKKHYRKLVHYDGKPVSIPFAAEVKILEIISKRSHPNVNKYLGCVRNGDTIGGICLEKLECTLFELVQCQIPADQAPPFQPDVIISGIKAGIDHIHSFGLVHGDINPSNIMLDKTGNAIIIDLDSCVAVGARCGPGTPGWSKLDWKSPNNTAAFENDAYGLDLVAKYIRGEYDGNDFDFGFDDEPQDPPKPQETDAEQLSTSSHCGELSIIQDQDDSSLSPHQPNPNPSLPATHVIEDSEGAQAPYLDAAKGICK